MYKVKLDDYVLYHPEHPSATLTDPTLELEPGYAGIFQATIPFDNPLYNRVFCRKSMVSVFRDDKEIFYGEVRKIPKVDRHRNKQIYCTGALSFLADSIQPQAEYHNISPADLLKTMLDIHNSQVEQRKQIQLGTVTITDSNNSLYRYTNFETTLEAVRDKLVDRLGGYLRLRHEDGVLILDWVSIEEYGAYSSQPIEFGLNLLDYSETTSAEDVVTALIPLGAVLEGESEIEALDKRVDITSVNDGLNYVSSQEAIDQFGWVWATNTWDDVTLPKNLLAKAREWLTTTQFETMSLQLTAADLSELGQDYDAFAEGDRIHCRAKPYGMDIVLPIMKLTIPLQNPAGRTLELSSHRQKTYTSQQSAVKTQLTTQQTEIATVANRNMQQSIDNLTGIVTGANGGYKLTEYDEAGRWIRDLYMNAPDKRSASHLLQISKDGIAASTNGYEGPYTIGITINGQILGSWIAANAIEAKHLSQALNTWIQKTTDGLATAVVKSGIIAAINQSEETAVIAPEKINLNGASTANRNTQIDASGKLTAKEATLFGCFSTQSNSEDPYIQVVDRRLVLRLGDKTIGFVTLDPTCAETYGDGISIVAGDNTEDGEKCSIQLISYDQYLVTQNLYTKQGESSPAMYKGVTGTFLLDDQTTTLQFVNGLLVEEVSDINPEEPEDPGTPEDPENPSEGETPEAPGTTEDPEQTETP